MKFKKMLIAMLAALMAIFLTLGLASCTQVQNFFSGATLEYELSEDGAYYIVTGVDCARDGIVLTIPDTYKGKPVKEIDKRAFASCVNLTEVVIPDSVTSIGDGAFDECSNLTSVTMGNGVTSIGFQTFYECASLTSVTIPDSVTNIDVLAFAGCVSLTEIVISDGVTSIAESAFSSCERLTQIVLTDSVTSVGDFVFSGCVNLTSVYYKGTASDWDNILFGVNWELDKAAKYYYSEETPTYYGKYWRYEDGEIVVWKNYNHYGSPGLAYELNDDGKSYSVVGLGTCKDQEIAISAIYEGLPVTNIGSKAFYKCEFLTEVIIPDSVTSIGEGAFNQCYRLTGLVLPEGLTSISEATFFACRSLTELVIPDSVISIADGAFLTCDALKNIVISDNVTNIGACAFENCRSLTSVVIPGGVTSIGQGAFWSCDSLTNVTFNGTVEVWNAIEKGEEWNYDVPATEVVCSDGSVALK